jgi:flagellar biosynthesis regulator FlaF
MEWGMQRIRYGEILEDDQQLARERERMALDQSILLLEQAGAIAADDFSDVVAVSKAIRDGLT